MRELEEKKSKQVLILVQQKHTLCKYQNERDHARRLRRFGSTRRMMKEADSQDLLSCESCRSSVVDHVEEMSLEFLRKTQDEQEVMGMPREVEEKIRRGWNQKEKRRRWKPKFFGNGVEGVPGYPDGEGHYEWVQVKKSRSESEVPGEEEKEVKSSKRKVIRVESEETQDYVRTANYMKQEEAEEKSFVPSAINVPQNPFVSL